MVGVKGSFHLARVQVGLSEGAVRLAQCRRSLKITMAQRLPMQIDGEPWIQDGPCEIVMEHRALRPMLRRSVTSVDDGAAHAFQVLDWGMRSGVISADQRQALLTELALRLQDAGHHAMHQRDKGKALPGGNRN